MNQAQPAESLRPYQFEACEKIAAYLDSEPDRQLVVMATGTGKTHVIAEAARSAHQRWWKTLILVHRHELIEQIENRLRENVPGVKVGVEEANRRADRDSDVVVASVATIGRRGSQRLQWFQPGLVIIDEGHHAPAETYGRVISRLAPDAHVLGLTATAHRTGRTPLYGAAGSFYSGILYEYGLEKGMADGWLCPLRGYAVRTDCDLSKVRLIAGDFSESGISEVVNVEGRTGAAYKAWADLAVDRRTIVFAADVDHAKSITQFFRERGVGAQTVTGETPKATRAAILAQYRKGVTRVIVNVGVLMEGFDAPETGCILLLRPTHSWTTYCQMIGRGTRTAQTSAKTDCIVIDVLDITGRHSLCTMPALAGLPAKTDMQGATILEARQVVAPEALQHEELTLEDLRARIDEVEMEGSGRAKQKIIDLMGQRFGKLEAVELMPGRKWGCTLWRCKCDCGGEKRLSVN